MPKTTEKLLDRLMRSLCNLQQSRVDVRIRLVKTNIKPLNVVLELVDKVKGLPSEPEIIPSMLGRTDFKVRLHAGKYTRIETLIGEDIIHPCDH